MLALSQNACSSTERESCRKCGAGLVSVSAWVRDAQRHWTDDIPGPSSAPHFLKKRYKVGLADMRFCAQRGSSRNPRESILYNPATL